MKRGKRWTAMLFTVTVLTVPALSLAAPGAVLTAQAHHGYGHRVEHWEDSYYYCGGHSAHLHSNGICPYASPAPAQSYKPAPKPDTQAQAAPAKKDYSPVFDMDYYYNNNPDLQAAYGYDYQCLLDHYLTTGIYEGRQGCEGFSVEAYMQNNPDLEAALGTDPLNYCHHYMDGGCSEGRVCY